MTTPNDLPSVGTPTEFVAQLADELVGREFASHPHVDALIAKHMRALVSERDELASRVRELEGAVKGVLAWDEKRNFPIPYKVRDPLHAALNASKEQP